MRACTHMCLLTGLQVDGLQGALVPELWDDGDAVGECCGKSVLESPEHC